MFCAGPVAMCLYHTTLTWRPRRRRGTPVCNILPPSGGLGGGAGSCSYVTTPTWRPRRRRGPLLVPHYLHFVASEAARALARTTLPSHARNAKSKAKKRNRRWQRKRRWSQLWWRLPRWPTGRVLWMLPRRRLRSRPSLPGPWVEASGRPVLPSCRRSRFRRLVVPRSCRSRGRGLPIPARLPVRAAVAAAMGSWRRRTVLFQATVTMGTSPSSWWIRLPERLFSRPWWPPSGVLPSLRPSGSSTPTSA